MSQAVIHRDTIYLAGQVAHDTSDDVSGQMRQILERLDALLAQAGSDKAHLLYATIWLADFTDYDAINVVWDAWVEPGKPPARACVESKLTFPDYLVEVAAIAARK